MSATPWNLLESAATARQDLIDADHETAFRLFNGFTEGAPGLVIDIFGRSAVIQEHADRSGSNPTPLEIRDFLLERLSWLLTVVVKRRSAAPQERRGILIHGNAPDSRIREDGVWYALDLRLNRDASFYLDTRGLRRWLTDHAAGWSVLNTFAYTGSLGIAALAGGAACVVQHDLNPRFLELSLKSCTLNGFSPGRMNRAPMDFFELAGREKRAGRLYDCVILDPPFFSVTSAGRVDQVRESARLINKVRPLVADGGVLIAINNALYVSGREYMQLLESLCRDGYLSIREVIAVPGDVAGFLRAANLPADPAPFNHSTKIVILEVRRRQDRNRSEA